MDINEVKSKYTTVRVLDKDEKGIIEVVRCGEKLFVLRTMNGNISPYIALKKIPSPFIPKIEYAASDGEKTVVVEEYIEGGKDISSLTDEKSIVSAFCELCDVLTLLHSRGIVHRDIKPSNILIAPDGHIRLIDFDASRRYDESKDNDTRYLGTKGYAPPEQFGYSQTNAASDIYSLGVTLKTVLGKRSDKRKFRYVIRKCTEFDPKNRYQSTAAVKRALKFNYGFDLPAILFALAAAGGSVYLGSFIYNSDLEMPAETYVTTSETSFSSSAEYTTTPTSETTEIEITVTSVPTETTSEESTVLPETEVTTEETTEETTEKTTEETTEPQITETVSSSSTSTAPTSVTTIAPTTKAATQKSTAALTAKVTTVKTTTAAKTETTVPSASETELRTTSPTGLPSGIYVDLELTCMTDNEKVPEIVQYKANNGRTYDKLADPYEFISDGAVLGTWNMLNYSPKGLVMDDNISYNGLKKDQYYDTHPQKVVFNNDGTVNYMEYKEVGSGYEPVQNRTRRWTYGLISHISDESYAVYERYYLYIDESGEEYLFVQLKNGDYTNSADPGREIIYYIYERDKSV